MPLNLFENVWNRFFFFFFKSKEVGSYSSCFSEVFFSLIIVVCGLRIAFSVPSLKNMYIYSFIYLKFERLWSIVGFLSIWHAGAVKAFFFFLLPAEWLDGWKLWSLCVCVCLRSSKWSMWACPFFSFFFFFSNSTGILIPLSWSGWCACLPHLNEFLLNFPFPVQFWMEKKIYIM